MNTILIDKLTGVQETKNQKKFIKLKRSNRHLLNEFKEPIGEDELFLRLRYGNVILRRLPDLRMAR